MVNVNVNELRMGFSNTTRNPEGILSHNNRKVHKRWRVHETKRKTETASPAGAPKTG
jgi:hypothetical protein